VCFVAMQAFEFYSFSLHDALPISPVVARFQPPAAFEAVHFGVQNGAAALHSAIVPATDNLVVNHEHGPDGDASLGKPAPRFVNRSEEHTSELQSRENLVCRLLLVR